MKTEWEYEPPAIDPDLLAAVDAETRALIIDAKEHQRQRVNRLLQERDFSGAMDLVGNEERSTILFGLLEAGVPATDLAPIVLQAWDHGPRDHQSTPPRVWIDVFRKVGFVSEPLRERPESVEIWRGQPVGAAAGVPWSTNRHVAEFFRDRWTARGIPAELLHTVATGESILAMDDSRSEAEVIVDPLLLPQPSSSRSPSRARPGGHHDHPMRPVRV